jgi:hypothetical protein
MNPFDIYADQAMKKWEEFKLKNWAYLSMRDRPHPITGKVADRNPAIDAEARRLCDEARGANQAAMRRQSSRW